MTLKEDIAEYLGTSHEEIAEDLCKAFDLPFKVDSQRVSMELTDTIGNRRYKLTICLKELKPE